MIKEVYQLINQEKFLYLMKNFSWFELLRVIRALIQLKLDLISEVICIIFFKTHII